MSVAELKQSKKLDAALLKKLAPGPERGGLILKGSRLIELTNIAEKPEEGFLPQLTADLMGHFDVAIGTWHTHPGSSANLSAEDWSTFVQWPDMAHAIVGTDGVRWYAVAKGAVVNA